MTRGHMQEWCDDQAPVFMLQAELNQERPQRAYNICMSKWFASSVDQWFHWCTADGPGSSGRGSGTTRSGACFYEFTKMKRSLPARPLYRLNVSRKGARSASYQQLLRTQGNT